MSKNALSKSRHNAYKQQQARCIYCERPTWLSNPQAFSHQYKITLKQARLFQCTAEHLTARQDGGKDDRSNIVAACHFCNQGRHKRKKPLDPVTYKDYVTNRVVKGRWNTPIMNSNSMVAFMAHQ